MKFDNNMDDNNSIIVAEQRENMLYQDACQIIEQAQQSAYRQINETLIKRNWLLGMRIQHEVLRFTSLIQTFSTQ